MGRTAAAAVVAVTVVLAASASAEGAGARPKVVVLNIKPIDESTQKIAAALTEIVTTDLAKTGRFEVMAESEIGSLVGFEKQKQLLGCTEMGCLAEIGGALGSDYLLLGTLGKVGEQYRIDLKLADVKKTRIAGRDGTLVDSVQQLVAAGRTSLNGVLSSLGGEAAAPPVETRSQARASGVGPAPYVVLGIGGAALVAGGVLAGVTVAQKRDLTYQDADTRASAGLVVGGVGLAAVAAGVIWALVGPAGGSPQTQLGVVPTSDGAVLCAAGTFF